MELELGAARKRAMSSVRTFSRMATGEDIGSCDCIIVFSWRTALWTDALARGPLVLLGRTLTEAGRASSCKRGTGASKLGVRTVWELEGRFCWVLEGTGAALGGGASGTKGFSFKSQDR